jgi:hypothetical protein
MPTPSSHIVPVASKAMLFSLFGRRLKDTRNTHRARLGPEFEADAARALRQWGGQLAMVASNQVRQRGSCGFTRPTRSTRLSWGPDPTRGLM